MNVRRVIILWSAVIVLGAISAVGWSALTLVDAKEYAARAGDDLADAQKLAGDIRSLRNHPSLAVSQESPTADFSRALDAAMKASDTEANDLVRVTSEAPRRVKDTDYQERPTRLMLQNLSLEQVVQFLTAVISGRPALSVDGIHLTAPHDSPDADAWAAEFTISYLVYSPKEGAPGSPRASASPSASDDSDKVTP